MLGLVGFGLCVLWLLLCLRIAHARRAVPPLPEAPAREDWPRVSIIVPACNEREALPRAAERLLALDYPDFELIYVDDRSDDGTGDFLRSLAEREERVSVVSIEQLEPGWLGKIHALRAGLARADGALVLFSDADAELGPSVLRRAVAYGQAHGFGFLTLIPWIRRARPDLDLLIAGYAAFALLGQGPVARDGRLGHRQLAGVGAFLLIERALLEAEDLAWLRLEILDDVGLSLRMRDKQVPRTLLDPGEDLALAWYPSLGAMLRGLQKSVYGVLAQYRLVTAVVVGALFLLVSFGPLLVLAHPSPLWQAAGGVLWAAGGGALLWGFWRGPRRAVSLLALPLGFLLLAACLLTTAARVTARGGIVWRGTSYALSALREGQRVKF